MNYIAKLQAQVKSQAGALEQARAEINTMLEYLESGKFTGVGPGGERKDWIATGDVKHWLMGLRSLTQVD